ncbi:MAG: hypothetical protein Q9195_004289 [Heterodermia aff. obscurata]
MELFRSLKSKTKEKTKKLVSVNDAKLFSGTLHESDDIMDQITGDPAFNPGAIEDQRRRSKREGVKAALDSMSSFATSLSSPKDAIKGKAARTMAGKLSKAERPYLSHGADIEFLDANDNLSRAESSLSSRQVTSDEELEDLIGGHRDKVNGMKAHRESLRVGYATSRHVKRVRVVPKRHLDFPTREPFFRSLREGGTPKKYDWLKWVGHILLWLSRDFSAQYVDDFDELPYDIDSIRRHIERIVIASAPWQAWAMDVRSVYRWERPRTTARWLVVYVVLWSTDHIIGFLYAYILYISFKSYFFPSSIGSLRASMQRAHDRNQSAYRFGELIDKHGSEGWLEPLMKDMGPYIQLQLGDIANMLEVFANFYNWASPRKTVATLWFFAACLLLSLYCNMAFCVKITGFIAGGTFFLCWPIASHYPKYRYLVSPFKWVMWDIPTDAELAFQYLRRRAQMSRAQIIEKKVEEVPGLENASSGACVFAGQSTVVPKITLDVDRNDEAHEGKADRGDDESWHSADSSSSVLEGTDILSFRARWGIKTGRLIVYANGVRFVRNLNRKELWRRSFLEMAEMRKLEGSTASRLTLKRPEELELTFTDGNSIILGAMNDRDEAFNSIIGFSALQWQVSQSSRSLHRECELVRI